jgi:hypothetical protein
LKSIQKVIATIACGLYSSTREVVLKTFQVLTIVLQEFNTDSTMQEVSLSWFLSSEDGGLNLAVKAIKMHCSCAK